MVRIERDSTPASVSVSDAPLATKPSANAPAPASTDTDVMTGSAPATKAAPSTSGVALPAPTRAPSAPTQRPRSPELQKLLRAIDAQNAHDVAAELARAPATLTPLVEGLVESHRLEALWRVFDEPHVASGPRHSPHVDTTKRRLKADVIEALGATPLSPEASAALISSLISSNWPPERHEEAALAQLESLARRDPKDLEKTLGLLVDAGAMRRVMTGLDGRERRGLLSLIEAHVRSPLILGATTDALLSRGFGWRTDKSFDHLLALGRNDPKLGAWIVTSLAQEVDVDTNDDDYVTSSSDDDAVRRMKDARKVLSGWLASDVERPVFLAAVARLGREEALTTALADAGSLDVLSPAAEADLRGWQVGTSDGRLWQRAAAAAARAGKRDWVTARLEAVGGKSASPETVQKLLATLPLATVDDLLGHRSAFSSTWKKTLEGLGNRSQILYLVSHLVPTRPAPEPRADVVRPWRRETAPAPAPTLEEIDAMLPTWKSELARLGIRLEEPLPMDELAASAEMRSGLATLVELLVSYRNILAKQNIASVATGKDNDNRNLGTDKDPWRAIEIDAQEILPGLGSKSEKKRGEALDRLARLVDGRPPEGSLTFGLGVPIAQDGAANAGSVFAYVRLQPKENGLVYDVTASPVGGDVGVGRSFTFKDGTAAAARLGIGVKPSVQVRATRAFEIDDNDRVGVGASVGAGGFLTQPWGAGARVEYRHDWGEAGETEVVLGFRALYGVDGFYGGVTQEFENGWRVGLDTDLLAFVGKGPIDVGAGVRLRLSDGLRIALSYRFPFLFIQQGALGPKPVDVGSPDELKRLGLADRGTSDLPWQLVDDVVASLMESKGVDVRPAELEAFVERAGFGPELVALQQRALDPTLGEQQRWLAANIYRTKVNELAWDLMIEEYLTFAGRLADPTPKELRERAESVLKTGALGPTKLEELTERQQRQLFYGIRAAARRQAFADVLGSVLTRQQDQLKPAVSGMRLRLLVRQPGIDVAKEQAELAGLSIKSSEKAERVRERLSPLLSTQAARLREAAHLLDGKDGEGVVSLETLLKTLDPGASDAERRELAALRQEAAGIGKELRERAAHLDALEKEAATAGRERLVAIDRERAKDMRAAADLLARLVDGKTKIEETARAFCNPRMAVDEEHWNDASAVKMREALALDWGLSDLKHAPQILRLLRYDAKALEALAPPKPQPAKP